jgi:hypothetical protein
MSDYLDTDVHIFKDDSLTQRANTAGMALDIDVDTYVGVHKITIDTADNTVADFWEAGHDYAAVIEGTTIDGGVVNACVGTFSIANRRVAGQMCVSSIESLASQTSFTLTTGEASADDDAYNGCTIIVTDQVTQIQKAVGHISDYTGATRTVALHAVPLQTNYTMAVGDSVEIFATAAFANLNTIGQTAQTANDNGADINAILTGTVTNAAGADVATDVIAVKAETAVLNAFWNVFILVAGTIGAVGNDTTHLHLTGLTYGDDELNDYIIVTYDASESEYHSSWITDWDNASALATVATLPFTPQDSTDQYWVFSNRKHPDVTDIKTTIGTAGAGLTEAGGDGDHLTAINLPNQTMDITGSITGNLSGSVGSVTGAVGSVAGNVDGNVTGTVAGVTPEAAGVAPTANEVRDAIIDDATKIDASALNTHAALTAASIATGVWDKASALTLDFGTLAERIYAKMYGRELVTDLTGAGTLRAIGDGSDLATYTISDDDTTTERTEHTFP